MQRQLPEFRGRTTVHLPERRTEVAVAGEPQIQAEGSQIVILREKVQRPREPQSQLIAI